MTDRNSMGLVEVSQTMMSGQAAWQPSDGVSIRLMEQCQKLEAENDALRTALTDLVSAVDDGEHDHSNVENEPCETCAAWLRASAALLPPKVSP